MAVCVAIIGKDNAPKFFRCTNPNDELKFQYKVVSSLDIIDEKLLNRTGEMKDLYLGILNSLETHKIYGYVTNTNIKFIVVVESTNIAIREPEIRSMFKQIHSEYADVVGNPFYLPGDHICGKSFDAKMKKILSGI